VRLVDANVLLYAVNRDEPHHHQARRWLDRALAGGKSVGFAWTVLLAFLRLSTRAQLFERPLRVDQAIALIEGWLDQPPAVLVEPTRRHPALVGGLLRSSGTAGNLVNDAHLAALALENDVTIVSFDRDSARFQGVRFLPPGED
jgi:uncharacterized protein